MTSHSQASSPASTSPESGLCFSQTFNLQPPSVSTAEQETCSPCCAYLSLDSHALFHRNLTRAAYLSGSPHFTGSPYLPGSPYFNGSPYISASPYFHPISGSMFQIPLPSTPSVSSPFNLLPNYSAHLIPPTPSLHGIPANVYSGFTYTPSHIFSHIGFSPLSMSSPSSFFQVPPQNYTSFQPRGLGFSIEDLLASDESTDRQSQEISAVSIENSGLQDDSGFSSPASGEQLTSNVDSGMFEEEIDVVNF